MALRDKYEWLLGVRSLSSGRRRGFLSFITVISTLGLALGVAVLLVVMSVMNGFESELRQRILAVTSHATLMGLESSMPDWQAARTRALTLPGVKAAVPYIESRAVLTHGERLAATQLRGVLPPEEVASGGLAMTVRQGDWLALAPGQFGIVLGEALADELQAKLGDEVVAIVPLGSVTPAGVTPRMRSFRVIGLFASGMYEYDRGLALIHAQDAAKLYRMGNDMSGVRLTLDDPLNAATTVRQLAVELGGGYFVSDWTRNHANFFSSIRMTKSMLFVILSMIVAIAAFNIVATLVMVVKDKQTDIAILRTLGAGPRNILAAFMVQGVVIGVVGVGLGVLLGSLLATNVESIVHFIEKVGGVQFLDARVYFMSDLPAEVRARDIGQVAGVALLLCAVATLYPAWRASRVHPAQALRHD